LRVDQRPLGASALVGPRHEEVALVPEPKVGALLQVVEEGDAFSNEGHLIRVVELEPEGTRRDRRGERGQGGAFLENDRLETGPLGEKSGGAADDAAADDDEVGGLGR
jgi:hypothetical protein